MPLKTSKLLQTAFSIFTACALSGLINIAFAENLPKTPVLKTKVPAGTATERINNKLYRVELCRGEFLLENPDFSIQNESDYRVRNINPKLPVTGLKTFNANFNSAPHTILVNPMTKHTMLMILGGEPGEAVVQAQETLPEAKPKQRYEKQWQITVKECTSEELKSKLGSSVVPFRQLLVDLDTEDGYKERTFTEPVASNPLFPMPAGTQKTPPVLTPEKGEFRAEIGQGLIRITFMVPQGQILVTLPEDGYAGETVSGHVRPLPYGDSEAKKQQNQDLLKQYTLELGNVKTPVDDQNFTVNFAGGAYTHQTMLTLKNANQELQAVMPLFVDPTPDQVSTVSQTDQKIYVPATIYKDKPVMIRGRFDGNSNNTQVTIGEQSARKLAESKRQLVVDNPMTDAGKTDMMVKEGDLKVSAPTENQITDTVAAQWEQCVPTLNQYKADLFSKVDRGWNPPKPPSKGEWTALLRYTLTRDLNVENIRIIRPSGFQDLDKSAESRVFQLKDQFKPFPSCFDRPSMEIDHTFKVIFQ